MASPPVTRFLDYGQFKYEQARREKEARRNISGRSTSKRSRLKIKIGKGDFDTKVRRSIEFLEDGDRVKVTVQFRGREVSHAYLGRDLLIRFAEQVGDHGTVERQPLLEGKQMSMVITSNLTSPSRSRVRTQRTARRSRKRPSQRRRHRRKAAADQGASGSPAGTGG